MQSGLSHWKRATPTNAPQIRSRAVACTAAFQDSLTTLERPRAAALGGGLQVGICTKQEQAGHSISEYLAHKKGDITEAAWNETKRLLDLLAEQYGNLKTTELTHKVTGRFLAGFKGTRAPGTLKRYHAIWQAFGTWLVTAGHLQANPFSGQLSLLTVKQRRGGVDTREHKRPYTMDELAKGSWRLRDGRPDPVAGHPGDVDRRPGRGAVSASRCGCRPGQAWHLA